MDFVKELYKKIFILDGAYGTRLQVLGLTEEDYRGKLLKGHSANLPLKGNYDVLNLTKPEVVERLHLEYIEAGARIIKTNTFNSTAISQGDYKLSQLSPQMALAGAQIARQAADRQKERVWVAGDIGPTNKMLSMSPEVSRPGYRATSFRIMEGAYYEQIAALDEGGVDLILIETIFDTLNAKAAIYAYERFYAGKGKRKPLWLSATITNKSGRMLSGQTIEAFWASIEHARPAVVGFNCAFGATQMLHPLRDLARIAPASAISCHPNAGLPNALGEYDDTPGVMGAQVRWMAEEGLVNILGGCCGTTPEHIRQIARAVEGLAPRIPKAETAGGEFCLSGLDVLRLPAEGTPFVMIGERTNVAGSPKFAAAAKNGDMSAALRIAAEQVRGGANLLDVNFDDALLEGPALMKEFVNLAASEPEIARVPLMLDSSRPEVIEAGLQCAQGKCVVNSLSLKDGEGKFLAEAAMLRRYGAAAVVMAFDESGQATNVERRVEICRRAYGLLTQNGFPASDIIFDPNILTIGTGIPDHAAYALDFIAAIPLIKKTCPGARVSGGLSNLSFAFRGHKVIREALHAVFLYHALRAGLDMAIVNAELLRPYESIDGELRKLCEDLILNKDANATEKLLEYARENRLAPENGRSARNENEWRKLPLVERLVYALQNGIDDFVELDAAEALGVYASALEVVEGPLMMGMRRVGDLFGEGKMFLPQVVKTARVMKEFVAALQPGLKQNDPGVKQAGKVLLATVKGDVHDIGKNIVRIVLECNNYEVVDLGVMVEWNRILEAIREHKPDIVGFSGLITPSLQEMIFNVRQLKKENVKLPILIGGATTSRLHTALKMAPEYFEDEVVVHVPDASRVAEVCQKILSPTQRAAFVLQTKENDAQLRLSCESRAALAVKIVPLAEARAHPSLTAPQPRFPLSFGSKILTPELAGLMPYIDWSPFFGAWGLKGVYPKIVEDPVAENSAQAKKLFEDAQKMLQWLAANRHVRPRGVIGFWPAWRHGDSVAVQAEWEGESRKEDTVYFHFLRQQRATGDALVFRCLADLVAAPSPKGSYAKPADSLGGFVVSAGEEMGLLAREFAERGDEYSALIVKALGDRIAEAFAEVAHLQARRLWQMDSAIDGKSEELLAGKYSGIRPAFGYPSLPDHTEKATLWRLLDAEEITGARLTQTFAMNPASTVCGLYFHHPQARYFNIGKIGADQLEDYAARKGWSQEKAKHWLATLL